ncbi:hypothetical protein [Prochlorococcus marinus]|uniref:hypothetical protein n=1 Tax=Prochlorococcus TaxID=1218 RepID=UPI0007B325C9|nr:hypothetical protein [Prochlorococcus marinus]
MRAYEVANDLSDLRPKNDQTGSNKKLSASKLQQFNAISIKLQEIGSTKAPKDKSICSAMAEEKWHQILPHYPQFKQ